MTHIMAYTQWHTQWHTNTNNDSHNDTNRNNDKKQCYIYKYKKNQVFFGILIFKYVNIFDLKEANNCERGKSILL